MTPQEKARETRQKHAEAQTAMWREQRELLKTAKEAMKRVLENKDATPEQLMAVDGVGRHTALLIRLVPAVAARYLQSNGSYDEQLTSTWQFRELLLPLFFGQRNELVYLVCLDGKNKLLVTKKLGEGIADTVQITTRKVLETALACNATRVVLAHNHVSGVAIWSDADLDTTLRLKTVLREADIELVDHFIIANDDMVSMADSGALKD